MSLKDLLEYRRSVRVYDNQRPIDSDKVRDCLEQATLAPNSSNLQLWEFIHITNKSYKDAITDACLGQTAASTADQWVVFVTRQDLHRKRAQFVLNFEKGNIDRNSPAARKAKRIAVRETYYGKLMPFLYSRLFRLMGVFRWLVVTVMGWFRPVVREVTETHMRGVAHKSCALAAQTFMLAMAEKGYDTCPMEGFDSRRVKRLLNLPNSAKINMIISCGIRKGNEGIWGERCRVPFDEVYRRI